MLSEQTANNDDAALAVRVAELLEGLDVDRTGDVVGTALARHLYMSFDRTSGVPEPVTEQLASDVPHRMRQCLAGITREQVRS